MGGTELTMLRVIESLNGGTFEHRICTVRGFDDLLVRSHGLGDRVYVAGKSEKGRQLVLGGFLGVMKEFQPHIVHSRSWGAIEAIPAARLARVPVAIHSEHGYEVEMLAGLPFRRRLLRRAIYSLADTVVAVTEELRSYHARQAWVSDSRFRVLPNGVDTSRFSPRPQAKSDIRRQLGMNAASTVVGTVGRMVPIKDYPTLLRASEVLVDRGIPVQVVLAGSGPELSKLQQLAAAAGRLAGRVTFLGSVANVEDVLSALDVFVLPSLSEGMSNTLLEAMASGLPVVAASAGGNPEVVEEGCSGLLFPPGDVGSLADCLEKLCREADYRQRLGQSARARVVRDFSLECMISRYRDLYLELACRRGLTTEHLN